MRTMLIPTATYLLQNAIGANLVVDCRAINSNCCPNGSRRVPALPASLDCVSIRPLAPQSNSMIEMHTGRPPTLAPRGIVALEINHPLFVRLNIRTMIT